MFHIFWSDCRGVDRNKAKNKQQRTILLIKAKMSNRQSQQSKTEKRGSYIMDEMIYNGNQYQQQFFPTISDDEIKINKNIYDYIMINPSLQD